MSALKVADLRVASVSISSDTVGWIIVNFSINEVAYPRFFETSEQARDFISEITPALEASLEFLEVNYGFAF